MVPVAGSAYTYAYATLGELVAWIIGWDLILEYGISVAPLAATLSGALQQLLGRIGLSLPPWAQTANVVASHGWIDLAHSQVDVLAFAAIVILAIILAVGIRESAATNVLLVVIQLVALVGFVVFLGGAVRPGSYHPFAPLGLGGIVTSAAVVFFAYIGFDTVTVASEERETRSATFRGRSSCRCSSARCSSRRLRRSRWASWPGTRSTRTRGCSTR